MPGFSGYLNQQTATPAAPAPTHGTALVALLTAALRARQGPALPQQPVMLPGAPDPEYQRGYEAGLELLRRQGR